MPLNASQYTGHVTPAFHGYAPMDGYIRELIEECGTEDEGVEPPKPGPDSSFHGHRAGT